MLSTFHALVGSMSSARLMLEQHQVRFLFDLQTQRHNRSLDIFLEIGCEAEHHDNLPELSIGQGLFEPVHVSRCGPAQHSMEALLQGAKKAIAVDVNPAMVEYARSKAQKAGVSGLSVYQGVATDLSNILEQV